MEPDPTGLEAGLNPYSYSGNNPVNAIDPTGENYIILNAPAGAGGQGHMASLMQYTNGGNWYYGTLGANIPQGTSPSLVTMATTGVPGYMSLVNTGQTNATQAMSWVGTNDTSNAAFTRSLEFQTSNAMNQKIMSTAITFKNNINNGVTNYNLLTNNCSNPVINELAATGINLPSMVSPSPNSNFDTLQANQSNIQDQLNQFMQNQSNSALGGYASSNQYNFETPQFNFHMSGVP
jgi:hypothetical protein